MMRGSKRSPNSPHTKKGSANHWDFFRVPTWNEGIRCLILWIWILIFNGGLSITISILLAYFSSNMITVFVFSAKHWQYFALTFVCQHLLIAAEYLALSTLDAWQLFPLTVPSSVGPLPSTLLMMQHAMVCNNLRRLLRIRQTTETIGMVDDGPSTCEGF